MTTETNSFTRLMESFESNCSYMQKTIEALNQENKQLEQTRDCFSTSKKQSEEFCRAISKCLDAKLSLLESTVRHLTQQAKAQLIESGRENPNQPLFNKRNFDNGLGKIESVYRDHVHGLILMHADPSNQKFTLKPQ